MYFTGFADEASEALDVQIKVTKELGWENIEARRVQVEGFPAGMIHDIPDEAFDRVADKLESSGVRINCFGSAIANWGKKSMSLLILPWRKSVAVSRACLGLALSSCGS